MQYSAALSPPPPPSTSDDGVQRPSIGEMEIPYPKAGDASSSALWDLRELLDVTLDDQFAISFDPAEIPTTPQVDPMVTQVSERVRKRDARLTCSNFLAGRVPCSCPGVDEKLQKEEVLHGKKRARTTRSLSCTARCQVLGCEADISELKGYHRRHRVCLRCASSSFVIVDEDCKRYCQQCGKFHFLSDFDEGKRSCRRKLERHNRLRRKAFDSQDAVEHETQGDLQTEDNGESGKDSPIVSWKEALVEPEHERVFPPRSAPDSQTLYRGASFTASGETQMDGGKDDPKFSLTPSCQDHKGAYSSMCPTGRISFKLYDWNPAEFPRRLRLQIFEWLAGMPVELEGYIRPGCTILTAFIAMPRFMWAKLFEDPLSYVHDLVVPGKLLSRKGPMFVSLNNMIFHAIKGGASVMEVNVGRQPPRLHCVHPMCFEVGKPIEFFACGSNILQHNFRFLVSFVGKYVACDHCVALTHGCAEGGECTNHQLCKIFIPRIESNLFGPAFIEVENENFIPILIGNKDICSEIKTIQQSFDLSILPNNSECEVSASRHIAFSEFVVDVAWLLKLPSSENIQHIMTSSQICRFNSLLKFLLHHDSTFILDKILQNLKTMIDKTMADSVAPSANDADMSLLKKYIDYANDFLKQKLKKSEDVTLQLEFDVQERNCVSKNCAESVTRPVASFSSEDLEKRWNGEVGVLRSSSHSGISDEVVNGGQKKSWNHIVGSNGALKSRPTVSVIAVIAVCVGACAVLLHPQEVSKYSESMRRCLMDRF